MSRHQKRAAASPEVAQAIEELASAFADLPFYQVRRWPSKLFLRIPPAATGQRGNEIEVSVGHDAVTGDLTVAVKSRSAWVSQTSRAPGFLSYCNRHHATSALCRGKRSVFACSRFSFGEKACFREELVPLTLAAVVMGERGITTSLRAEAEGKTPSNRSAWSAKQMREISDLYKGHWGFEKIRGGFSLSTPSRWDNSHEFCFTAVETKPSHLALGPGFRVKSFFTPEFSPLTAQIAADLLNQLEAKGNHMPFAHFGAWHEFQGHLLYHSYVPDTLKEELAGFTQMLPAFHVMRACWAENVLTQPDFALWVAKERMDLEKADEA